MHARPNILLISVDSLRADHLGCYGYHRETSPRIDALSRQGALVERLFCPGIPTYPSYTTLYTGQHPLTHGILAHGGQAKLSKQAPFLPEILVEAGYTTCAFDNLIRGRPWFGRGYEYYIDPSVRHTVLTVAVTSEDLNGRAIPWLRTPDGVITDAEYVAALYDQEIRHLDDGVAKLVGTLDDLGLGERTLVIFTADHGESLTEHGIYFEHHGLYDCTLHIPFFARWPGRLPARRRVRPMLQVSDIAPTLLEAVGLPAPSPMEGRSFWKLLTGQDEQTGHDRVITAECSWEAKWSLRTDRHKFILSREPDFAGHPPRQLFDLRADPAEDRNLVEDEPELAREMEQALEGWIAERLKTLGKDQDPLIQYGPSMRGTLQESP